MKMTTQTICSALLVATLTTGCSAEKPVSTLASAHTADQSVTVGSAVIQAWGRAYTNSCGFYTNSMAEVDISIKDTSITWGQNPVLLSGLSFINDAGVQTKTWDHKDEVAMSSVDQSTWKIRKTITLAERGNPDTHNTLSIVVKIPSTGGDHYIKPATGNSYWNINFELGNLHCRAGDGHEPQMVALKLSPVID